MALASLSSELPVGPMLPAPFTGGVGTDTVSVVDAANEGVAMIFSARETVTIDVMSFRITAATSAVLSCSIEALNASGDPDGTAIGSAVLTGTLSAAGVVEVTGLGAAVTAGTSYAAVVRYSSGTTVSVFLRQNSDAGSHFPHMSNNVGAGWVKVATGNYGCSFGIGTSTTAYKHWNNTNGPHTLSDQTYTDADTPDEYGLRFQVPVAMRCTGLLAALALPTGGTIAVVLTDSSGNDVGATFKSYDSDLVASISSESMAFFPLAAAFTLVADTTYVLGIKSTSAGNMTLRKVTMGTNGQLGAWYSKEWFQATRTGATSGNGAWTFTADTICPLIWPLIDQIHDGAGGSSGGARILGAGRISGG